MTNEMALATIETTEVELLDVEQSLFLEGREIGTRLEGGFAQALLDFYRAALPYAERVKRERPWEHPDFARLKGGEPQESFLKFLREAFAASMETMAYHQAVIVRMMVDQGWTLEDVTGIGLKRLWRVSNVVRYLSTDDQRRLLEAAKSEPYRDFDALCKGLKKGYHVEPVKDKLISGSKSAMAEMDKYLEARRQMGDLRMQGEILADTVGSVMIAEGDFTEFVREASIIGLLCDTMRHFNHSLKGTPNLLIVAEIAGELLHGYSREMPEYLFKRYEQLLEVPKEEDE